MQFTWTQKTTCCAPWCVSGAVVLAFGMAILIFTWHLTHSSNQDFAGYRFTVQRDFAHIPQARAMLEGAQKL